MKIFGQSDIGSVRKENQDCFAVQPMQDGLLAVVCDGMGGAAAGSLASELTCRTFTSAALTSIEACRGQKIAQCLSSAADAANRAVFTRAMDNPECEGMGSTLVALYTAGDGVFILNVGDSAAYRIRSGELRKLTHDHSLVQELVDSGKISAEQARRHPRKNVITRVIGGDVFVRSDIFECDAETDDVFLLCSDGLINAVPEEFVLSACRDSDDPETVCRTLIAAALERGARDNVTAVVLIYQKGAGIDE